MVLTSRDIVQVHVSKHVSGLLVFETWGRLIQHQANYRIEVYWTRSEVGVRNKLDGSSAYFTKCDSLEAGIRLCNDVASPQQTMMFMLSTLFLSESGYPTCSRIRGNIKRETEFRAMQVRAVPWASLIDCIYNQ